MCLDPLPWLSSVPARLLSFLYSLLVIDWGFLLGCLLILYPGSLAWDVDISLVRRVFLVKSVPTSAHTQLNSVFRISVITSKKVGKAFFFTVFEFMAGSVVASA